MWYRQGLSGLGDKIEFARIPEGCESSCHLFQIVVDRRDDLMLALNRAEIYPGVHYECNTNYPMYSYAKGTCPNADRIGKHVVSLPMNLYMMKEDVDRICEKIRMFLCD